MRRFMSAAPSMRGVGTMSSSEVAIPTRSWVGVRPRMPRLDRAELGLLAIFAIVSLWVLGLDLWQVVDHGRVWTGTDGSYSVDQLQYLAWIQSASRHVLVANMFVIHGTPADYFQPAVAISGLLVAIGVAPWLALLLWKPVGLIALFLAVRTFARRSLPEEGRGPWLAIIALTLFYGSFTSIYGSFGVIGDLFPGFMSWGYPFALMALAALILALLSYVSARRSGRMSWTPGVLGGLAGLLHPWQGEVLAVIFVGLELTAPDTWSALRRLRQTGLSPALRSPRLRLAAVAIGGTLISLIYYAALDKLDLSWGLGRTASKHSMPGTAILIVLLPLLLVALPGYLGPPRNFLIRVARVWPLATIVVFLQSGTSAGATPLHAFFGITLPLSVLAVDGCLRLGWRRIPHPRLLATLLILVATVPASGYELYVAKANAQPAGGNANFITRSERQALSFLRRDPVPGGVLTRYYLGDAVPARTGRHTYVGDCIWSEPNCPQREMRSSQLMEGELAPPQARQFVSSTGARFVLTDCTHNANLVPALRPMLVSVRRFGCATVYQVR
jgi:hypothetical protein